MWIDEAANELYVADAMGTIGLSSSTRRRARSNACGAHTASRRATTDRRNTTGRAHLHILANPVHCVRIAHDGLVYVCDRINDRYQVFHKDGTFVREVRERPETLGNGSVWSMNFYPPKEQTYLLIADGENNEVRIVRRDTDTIVGHFGHSGRNAGDFHWCTSWPSIHTAMSTRAKSTPPSASNASSRAKIALEVREKPATG